MKYFLMALVLFVAAYLTWHQFKPKPPPPPPPVPPILQEPAPVINEAEQAKVIKATKDQNPEVRLEAIKFLDKMRVPAALDVMFDKIRHDEDLALRIKVIQLLGDHSDPPAEIAQDPLQAPKDPSPDMRTIAQNLLQAAQDHIPDIRIAALQALDKLGDYTVAPVVTDSLKDPDEKVRLQALKTLTSLQDKKAAIIEAEKKRQEELRRQAAEKEKGGKTF